MSAYSSPPLCEYFADGRCRSCSFIETPLVRQLSEKDARSRRLLPSIPEAAWLPIFESGERDFRNRAKLVVGGTPGRVTLGILDSARRGVDLRNCLIQEPAIRTIIPVLAEFIETSGLAPYDVAARRGELKFVHVTAAPSGELMIRFVGRTQHSLDRLRKRVPELRRAIPNAVVISVNLLPEHRAVLEGEREEVLLGSTLPMQMNGVTLHLRPQSFFQTNSEVARALYAQASAWVERSAPASLWDLYCGVGGFALSCAAHTGREVLGIELSSQAVASARRSAREAGIRARFEAADATSYALNASPEDAPDLVIVNPPRRGIGAELAAWLEQVDTRHVIYSSCNPESLARDLRAMPSLEPREARVFDMFPHTAHMEVMVLLQRKAS